MFTGTIRDNILYGKTDATEEELIKAARMANIHEFIEALPEGYDTYIGERGVKLSGGQKQRISIARVFLKNPPIVVAHRLSTIKNADEIVVLGNEGIIEKGTHDELLEREGEYSKLHKMAAV